MGDLQTLHSRTDVPPAQRTSASVIAIEPQRCSLCGTSLRGDKLKFNMVSPRAAGTCVIVCNTCHRAALGEGYRPAS